MSNNRGKIGKGKQNVTKGKTLMSSHAFTERVKSVTKHFVVTLKKVGSTHIPGERSQRRNTCLTSTGSVLKVIIQK